MQASGDGQGVRGVANDRRVKTTHPPSYYNTEMKRKGTTNYLDSWKSIRRVRKLQNIIKIYPQKKGMYFETTLTSKEKIRGWY